MTGKTTQEQLTEARNVLQTLEAVQRYGQTEGKQSSVSSNISQTITGLRECIQVLEASPGIITEALQQSQSRGAGAHKS